MPAGVLTVSVRSKINPIYVTPTLKIFIFEKMLFHSKRKLHNTLGKVKVKAYYFAIFDDGV